VNNLHSGRVQALPFLFYSAFFLFGPKKRSGPKLVSFSREETSPARYLKTL